LRHHPYDAVKLHACHFSAVHLIFRWTAADDPADFDFRIGKQSYRAEVLISQITVFQARAAGTFAAAQLPVKGI
jgi:hypothetical protein